MWTRPSRIHSAAVAVADRRLSPLTERNAKHPQAWPPEGPVLLFDGVCHLCQRSVQFVLRREREPRLLFCALQSPAGQDLLVRHGLPSDHAASLVLIEGGRAHLRSDAALQIAGYLRVPWKWTRVLKVMPRTWRDWLYNFIATRRYVWFGRDETVCLMPEPGFRDRFLDHPPETPLTR